MMLDAMPPDFMARVTPVILAGGAGMRLRPLTGTTRPKPFLKVSGRYSLLQDTARRAQGFKPPVVVTDKAHGQRVLQELCDIDLQPSKIILEPAARSTAAAIAQAALTLEAQDIMLVMPSDHYIQDPDSFQLAALHAAEIVQDGGVVMIGARASYPSDRYGYIRCAEGGNVDRFIEKPSVSEARSLLGQGSVFWNTGVFSARADSVLKMFEEFAPAVMNACKEAHGAAIQSGVFYEPDYIAFASAPAEPIDTAVMEKISGARLVSLETRWSDVGAWPDFLRVKMGACLRLNKL